MAGLLATMITTTSYGTWLPGDMRGYVERGMVLPPNPKLLKHSRSIMSSEPVVFTRYEQDMLFRTILAAAEEFHYRLLCVSIESWHLHWLVEHRFDKVDVMVGRLKTRMRQALDRGRIWTVGYDKRFCYTQEQVEARFDYIRRHVGHRPLRNVSLH